MKCAFCRKKYVRLFRQEVQEMKKMAVVFYIIAAVCVCYAVGIVMTKAAGTRFFMVWFGIAAMLVLGGIFFQKGIWYRMPQMYRIGLVGMIGTAVFSLFWYRD